MDKFLCTERARLRGKRTELRTWTLIYDDEVWKVGYVPSTSISRKGIVERDVFLLL